MFLDEDEEVLFSNSPLNEYLKEVAPLSFSSFDSEAVGVEGRKDECVSVDVKCNSWFFKKQIQCYEILHACELLLQISSFTEEDAHLLVDLKDELRHHLKDYAIEKTQENIFDKKLTVSAVIAVIIAVLVYLGAYAFYEEILLVLFLLTIASVIIWYVHKYYLSLPRQMLSVVVRYCEIVNSFEKLLDKTVLHLKEVEVINHGHMTYNSPSFLGMSSRKCLKLRSSVTDGLESIFMQIRTNQRVLLKQDLNDFALDYKEEYLALLPLDKFSSVFTKTDVTDANDMYLPLDQIKTCICVYRYLQSEFIYSTVVCLYASYCDQVENSIQLVNDVLYSADSISNCIAQNYLKLQTNLNASMKVVYERKEQMSPSKPVLQEQTVESLLHSSEVELYSALARIDEMKNMLLSNDVSFHEKQKDTLKVLFLNYILALENSKTCLEDVLEKVVPSERKQNSDNDVCKDNLNTDEFNEPYVKLHELNKPEGDTLFEGESEGRMRTSEPCGSAEDMERILKESRASKKLMKELKTILSVKESPVGLLSFPLQRPTVDELESDSGEEFICEELGTQVDLHSKIQGSRTYNYNPEEDNDCDSENADEEPVERIGLPLTFLQNFKPKSNFVEETFGSSDEDCEN